MECDKLYSIYLEGFKEVRAGWYTMIPSVRINTYIYCRGDDRDKANKYSKAEAIRIVMDMCSMGYKARVFPPITLTL